MLNQLEENAAKWLEKYPALKAEQLSDPLKTASKLIAEVHELTEALHNGNEYDVLDELTDVMNYAAQLRMVIRNLHGITEEQILDHSNYKYFVRNGSKYDTSGYQEGADTEKQMQADANLWHFFKTYYGEPEIGKGGEYY